ncbi:SAM-dependent methyltransferase [Kitasatospora sp. NPDC052896]|uniref:SAM-dependent methyltransferase n=1 Tax=Kitasatospora sp. NPDC052896 TaxID=3364061 RepID=UPI0037C7D583
MDRSLRSRLAHAHHPIAAPLSDPSVATLLARALRRGDERLLDLGCGEAAWLLRALAAHPGVTADGVDLDPDGLARAQQAAEQLGVARRLGLHHRAAAEFTAPHPYDLVLSVGATHAFGGPLPTLAAARGHLAPGGAVLLGEGYWQTPPGEAATAALGGSPDEFDDLPTLVERIVADGWIPVYAHLSTQHELDDYEWCWTGSLAGWALDHPELPEAAEALAAATAHRTGWLRGYRGTFGFVTFLLRPA